MQKGKIIGILILVLLIGAGIYFTSRNSGTKTISGFDPKNAVYNIEDMSVSLVNGEAQTEVAPGSASKVITKYFGNSAVGDLNSDKVDDSAYLITQDGGGSGTFYYAVAVLKTEKGYKITNSVFLGDRIAPQSTEIKDGKIYVNYAERKVGEPMSADPSVGVTKTLKVTPLGQLMSS